MDSQIEANEIQVNKRKPLTVEELQAEVDALSKPLDELWERNASFDEREEKKQYLLRDFAEKQISEKERYENIFRTEQGSIYFTLPTGESLRIKQRGDEWKLQPLCRKVFYVDSQQGEDLLLMLRSNNFQEEIIGAPIKTVSCGIGAMPVEFGITHMPEIKFSEEPGEIIIKGDSMGVFASGYHQGHPITEIIK